MTALVVILMLLVGGLGIVSWVQNESLIALSHQVLELNNIVQKLHVESIQRKQNG